MNHEDIYVNDINNRFPNRTLIKTINGSLTTFEFLNGATIIARSTAGSAEDAVFKLRSTIVGSFDILPILTATQRDDLTDVDIGQQIIILIGSTHRKQFFNGASWRTMTDT